MHHDGYSIERLGHRVRANCTCGWRSDVLPSGGLAGAAWDAHVDRAATRFTAVGRLTTLDSSAS
jgi:hypothetical protein